MLARRQHRFERRGQLRLDLLRQARRRRDAARHRPDLVEALLLEGRRVGQEARALRRHHAEQAQLPGAHLLGDLADIRAEHLDVSAERLGLRLRGRARVHHDELRAGLGRDPEDRQMIVAARAIGRDRDAVGRLLRGLDHVLDGLERTVGLHRPDVVVDHVIDQRREAVEAFLAADLRIEIARIHARHVEIAERIAVRPARQRARPSRSSPRRPRGSPPSRVCRARPRGRARAGAP